MISRVTPLQAGASCIVIRICYLPCYWATHEEIIAARPSLRASLVHAYGNCIAQNMHLSRHFDVSSLPLMSSAERYLFTLWNFPCPATARCWRDQDKSGCLAGWTERVLTISGSKTAAHMPFPLFSSTPQQCRFPPRVKIKSRRKFSGYVHRHHSLICNVLTRPACLSVSFCYIIHRVVNMKPVHRREDLSAVRPIRHHSSLQIRNLRSQICDRGLDEIAMGNAP